MQIDLSKIYWAFWQSSEAYPYDEHTVCLFTCGLHSNNAKDVFHHGHFRLFKTFKMSDGNTGVNVTKPLFSFFANEPFEKISEDEFRAKCLNECYEKYFEDQLREAKLK